LRKTLFLLAAGVAAMLGASDVCAQSAPRPVVVAFSLPADLLAEIPSGLGVELLADGNRSVAGRLSIIDNQIDRATGTIRVKATFDDAGEMQPGQRATIHVYAARRALGLSAIGEVVP
jgi:multidrug efflux system membrane fusion protein